MPRALRRSAIHMLLLALLFTSAPRAQASIPTGTQVVLIFVAVGAVGAAIGVGVYYAVRRNPVITGCVVSGPGGDLTLVNESDQKTFSVIGDTAALKPGDRVRVKGRKKKNAAGAPTFLVDKMTRDLGACKAALPTP